MTLSDRARDIIAKESTDYLLDIWEMTTNCSDEGIPTLRGWLMDEFEKRNFDGFNAWLESDECNDRKLREYLKA